jgi:hypothetical protein
MDPAIVKLLAADSGESDWFKRALRDAMRQALQGVPAEG